MKKLRKSILAVLLCFNFSLQAIPVLAEETSKERFSDEEIKAASSYIEEIMNIINDSYIGSKLKIEDIVQGALKGMTDKLDSYSQYMTPAEIAEFEKGFSDEVYTTGISFQKNINEYGVVIDVIKDSSADKEGVLVGDEIVAINGTDIYSLSADEISEFMLTSESTTIQVVLKRGDTQLEVSLISEPTKVQTVFSSKINEVLRVSANENVRYIRIISIGEKTAEDFQKEVEALKRSEVKNIIIDLRGNPGGIVEQALEICRQLVPKGLIVSIRNKDGLEETEMSSLKETYFENIIVVTDQNTASAAEIITSALKESGVAKVVGTRTYGKGVIQSIFDLYDLGALKLTTNEYYSRLGNKINNAGVLPDIVVAENKYLEYGITMESAELKTALQTLGYKTNTEADIICAINKIQTENGLEVSNTLYEKLINTINILLYKDSLVNDRVLKRAYEELLNDMNKQK